MGKSRIQPLALLRLPPQLLIRVQKLCAHGLKRRTNLPQLVGRNLGNRKVELVHTKPFRALFEYGNRHF